MKLYYSPGVCSLADHIALIEGELPYDLVKVDLKTKMTEDGRDYTAINPKGYVPALELDDGALLTENIVILSYIAETAGALLPASGLPHWRVLETTAFVSGEIHKNFKPLFKPGSSEVEKDEAKAMLAKRYATLDAQLGNREFLVGDALSIADCYLFVTLMWAKMHALNLPAGLTAYFDRIKARPAVVRALSEEGLG